MKSVSSETKTAFLILLLISSVILLPAQSPDYHEIFGSNWEKAEKYVEDNSCWIKPLLEKHNVSYHEFIAIVFPELVRYSALRDKMEISLLKTLYRYLGDDYADFSVGVFQIKPSFAEIIHRQIFTGRDQELKGLFRKKSSFDNIKSYRTYVIADLENPETEINYIIAFYKLCEKQYGKDLKDTESRIQFLSTAYNSGFHRSSEEIMDLYDKKFFNTSLFKTDYYCYSDISLYWYKHYRYD